MIELSSVDLEIVRRILVVYLPGSEVRVFGSRARGRAKSYSDLDLAVYGSGPLDFDTLRRAREAFEESDLNFRVDVVDVHTLTAGFREAVDREAVMIQSSAAAPVDRKSTRLNSSHP